MAKRKSQKDPEDLPDAPDGRNKRKNDNSDSDEDMDMLNVDFEWFEPKPEIDFHGLKTLLRQLFDIDAHLFNLSELTDLILSQPLLCNTVKCDGQESDPFAFLTVLNLATHKDKKVVQDLIAYLARHSTNDALSSLSNLLASDSPAQVGLILSERFINMPHEIVPPLYSMLQDEIRWSADENKPYTFTHYLVISKAYIEVESTLPTAEQPPSKKKKAAKEDAVETFYFHPEDEILHKHAIGYGNYEYESPVDEGASDSKRAFQEIGVKPIGHMVLLEADKLSEAVESVKSFLGGQ